jgi:hypothetical protein
MSDAGSVPFGKLFLAAPTVLAALSLASPMHSFLCPNLGLQSASQQVPCAPFISTKAPFNWSWHFWLLAIVLRVGGVLKRAFLLRMTYRMPPYLCMPCMLLSSSKSLHLIPVSDITILHRTLYAKATRSSRLGRTSQFCRHESCQGRLGGFRCAVKLSSLYAQFGFLPCWDQAQLESALVLPSWSICSNPRQVGHWLSSSYQIA